MEDGCIELWDPNKLIHKDQGYSAFYIISEALLFRNQIHNGPVNALDFNRINRKLMATGSGSAQVTY